MTKFTAERIFPVMESELIALRKDAERYRWLRQMIYDDLIITCGDRMLHGVELDDAVDAAIKEKQP